MPGQRDLGPDLSAVGAKDVSQLSFGESHDSAKSDRLSPSQDHRSLVRESGGAHAGLPPVSGRPRCANDGSPEHDWRSRHRGTAKVSSCRASEATFHPAGEFGRVYERYKCYVCHQFNGFGGTLAPDLSYEGSRAQRQWLIEFLKDPKTVRPTLVLRMPQFNMTDQEAATLAAYIGTALNSPDVDPSAIDTNQFTAEKVALGKQLYEVKYECQSCHTIGSTGGYVGPNLNNAGNWLTPAWIEAWLRNPQALVPDTIEPRRAFTRRRDTGPDRVSADAARGRQTARFCAGGSHRSEDLPAGESLP